jgi:hypothetical protein
MNLVTWVMATFSFRFPADIPRQGHVLHAFDAIEGFDQFVR